MDSPPVVLAAATPEGRSYSVGDRHVTNHWGCARLDGVFRPRDSWPGKISEESFARSPRLGRFVNRGPRRIGGKR